jgi:hypothetical protein
MAEDSRIARAVETGENEENDNARECPLCLST